MGGARCIQGTTVSQFDPKDQEHVKLNTHNKESQRHHPGTQSNIFLDPTNSLLHLDNVMSPVIGVVNMDPYQCKPQPMVEDGWRLMVHRRVEVNGVGLDVFRVQPFVNLTQKSKRILGYIFTTKNPKGILWEHNSTYS